MRSKLSIFSLILTFVFIVSFSNTYGEEIDCGQYKGVQLPCWDTYLRKNEGIESLPYFPYAKRPNGCSVLNLPPGEADVFTIHLDTFSFKQACEVHDSCYYTLGSNRSNCNNLFMSQLEKECAHGSDKTRPLCMVRAKTFYQAAKSTSIVVFNYSQSIQRHYLSEVMKFILDHGQK